MNIIFQMSSPTCRLFETICGKETEGVAVDLRDWIFCLGRNVRLEKTGKFANVTISNNLKVGELLKTHLNENTSNNREITWYHILFLLKFPLVFVNSYIEISIQNI